MSTPTASLKKTKRSPLPYRGLPFRKNTPLLSLSPLKEGASLTPNDHTSHHHILEGIRNEGRVPKDSDLVTSMATRLATVERELLAAKREIIEKVIYLSCVHLSIGPSVEDLVHLFIVHQFIYLSPHFFCLQDNYIKRLEERFSSLQTTSQEQLELQCQALQQQVDEMEVLIYHSNHLLINLSFIGILE